MREDTYIWHGDGDAHQAAAASGGHVGGLSAAIAYGWSTAVEHSVFCYTDQAFPDFEGKPSPRIYAAGTWVRKSELALPMKPDVGVSLRRDGSGKSAPTSDCLRALVECCLDTLVDGSTDLGEILRSAQSEGITEEAIVAEAALHGSAVEIHVRDRVRRHFR
ncbi:MAG: hypothetical protein EOO66_03115 [Methylobacterium sp.]|nr:MAG: hypothetical protein EOO66_03115 [Methylobacterium sp.]